MDEHQSRDKNQPGAEEHRGSEGSRSASHGVFDHRYTVSPQDSFIRWFKENWGKRLETLWDEHNKRIGGQNVEEKRMIARGRRNQIVYQLTTTGIAIAALVVAIVGIYS